MKLHAIDNGYCRVYYKDENRVLYCLQEERPHLILFYECTKDGEPSHIVERPHILPMPKGDSVIEVAVRRWYKHQK